MSINISAPSGMDFPELKPHITVIGVGGAGDNAVRNMVEAGLQGVKFISANTDAQSLSLSKATNKVQLGMNLTQGLGAGAQADVGKSAAEENLDNVCRAIEGADMVFITAGMGGGTGTGAAPVIAAAARELGILTVGIVTKPFHFEGNRRMRIAEAGIEELAKHVDTLITIPNQNLFRIADEKTTFVDAFGMADNVLLSGVRGITDLMAAPGMINLDFADVHSIMSGMGKALMGMGEAEGEDRAIAAAEAAISNPLLDDVAMKDAQSVLINITGGTDMTLFEVDAVASRIRAEVDEKAYIIFGSAFDEGMQGRLRVSIVATGIDADINVDTQPENDTLPNSEDEDVSLPDSALDVPASPELELDELPATQTEAELSCPLIPEIPEAELPLERLMAEVIEGDGKQPEATQTMAEPLVPARNEPTGTVIHEPVPRGVLPISKAIEQKSDDGLFGIQKIFRRLAG